MGCEEGRKEDNGVGGVVVCEGGHRQAEGGMVGKIKESKFNRWYREVIGFGGAGISEEGMEEE